MPYYRRNIFVLSITVLLASMSWQQVVPFLPLYLKDLGAGGPHFALWVSAIYGAHALAAIIAQPFWGKLGDSVGRKPMILRAGFCLSMVYFALSQCHAPWQLAACRFLNGALTGFIPGSFALVGTNTPEEKAPRYVAILESMASIGLIIGPSIGGLLAYSLGYRGSLACSGAAVMLSTLAVAWLVKEPNKTTSAEKTSLLQDFKFAFGSPMLSSLLIAIALAWSFGNAINPFLVLHLKTLSGGQARWLPGVVYSLPGIAFVLSAVRWTRVGQKWGFDRTILIGLAGGAIGAACLSTVREAWVFAVLYFVTGICLATLSPGVGALTCTRVSSDFRGRAYAIQQAAGTLAALVTIALAGFAAKEFGYRAVFVLSALILGSGFFLFRSRVRAWPAEDAPERANRGMV